MNRYYAVKVGRTPGIYNSWNECNLQVKSFSGAKYKSFSTMDEAKAYLGQEPEIIPEGIPYAYVDGSFNAIGTGIYGYGGFLMDGDTKYILTGSGDDEEQAKMRNVTGEICGAMAAVEKAVELGIKELIIYYDYEGVAAWAKHEWKANKPGTAAYVDFMDRSKVKLYFKHVTAHTGVAGNEEADYLAKKAVGLIMDDILPFATEVYDYKKDLILSRIEYWQGQAHKLNVAGRKTEATAAASTLDELIFIGKQLDIIKEADLMGMAS